MKTVIDAETMAMIERASMSGEGWYSNHPASDEKIAFEVGLPTQTVANWRSKIKQNCPARPRTTSAIKLIRFMRPYGKKLEKEIEKVEQTLAELKARHAAVVSRFGRER